MNQKSNKGRGLGLCSGGLDSILSALVLKKQGITVEWVSFETPFFSADKARRAAQMLDIPLTVKPITPVYLEMLKNPPCGYGKYMNPCMDCHTLMFRLAGDMMSARGFDFLFSGEVLGQRPMSQTYSSLRYVSKNSGWDGLILRPLSAKKLPPTIVEEKGLVDRDQLLDLSGRSRKPQIALAKAFGVADYPSPAGGCLLTDKNYSIRLKDLMHHHPLFTETDLEILKIGRHFRRSPESKLVIGRTEEENRILLTYRCPETMQVLDVADFPGPIGLLPNDCGRESLEWGAAICAGYSKAPKDIAVNVTVEERGSSRLVQVRPVTPEVARQYLI